MAWLSNPAAKGRAQPVAEETNCPSRIVAVGARGGQQMLKIGVPAAAQGKLEQGRADRSLKFGQSERGQGRKDRRGIHWRTEPVMAMAMGRVRSPAQSAQRSPAPPGRLRKEKRQRESAILTTVPTATHPAIVVSPVTGDL